MHLESAYENKERMPAKYANKGVIGGINLSPPLKWWAAPKEAKSFALIMVDHHPVANEFVHWLVINIPINTASIEEGASGTEKMPLGSRELLTSYRTPGYGGPRPPVGSGDHPYETIIYALNAEKIDLKANADLERFLKAIEGKILAIATLTGYFSQP